MSQWKFTWGDKVAVRTLQDGGVEARLVESLSLEELATVLPADPPDYVAEKDAVLEQAKEIREKILTRLNGIQQDIEWNRFKGVLTDAQAIPQIDGIMTAKTGLKDITTYATVVAATTGAEATVAITARYGQLVAALYAASPYACTAFNGLDV